MKFPNYKKISIICPCFNEEKFIKGFVQDLSNQDLTLIDAEFLIIDGGSSDGTIEILKNEIKRDDRFKILKNPARTAPHALNIGINASIGDFIVRMDVHARYPANYIKTLIKKLESDPTLGNVGAAIKTEPKCNDFRSIGIALAMSSKIGVGGSKFRTGVKSDTYVDTVPFGCFPRHIFESVGMFNEKLTRSQDYEFNTRLKAKGFKILLTPDVAPTYYGREDFKKLASMYYQSALTKVFSNTLMKKFSGLRQFVPSIYYLSLFTTILMSILNPKIIVVPIFLLVSYLSFVFLGSFIQLARANKLICLPYMVVAVLWMHSFYAFGYIIGVIKFVILRQKNLSSELKITR